MIYTWGLTVEITIVIYNHFSGVTMTAQKSCNKSGSLLRALGIHCK